MQEWALKQSQDGEILANSADAAGHPADIKAEWEGARVMIRRVLRPRERHSAVSALLQRPRAVQIYSFDPEVRALLHRSGAGHGGRPNFEDQHKNLRLYWSRQYEKWLLVNEQNTVLMHSVGNGAGSYIAHPVGVTKWSKHAIVAGTEVGDEVSTTKAVKVDAIIAQVVPSRKGRTCYMTKFDWLPPDLAERSRVRVCDDQAGIKSGQSVGDHISFKREYELNGFIDEIRSDTYLVKLKDDALTNGPLAGKSVMVLKKDVFVVDM